MKSLYPLIIYILISELEHDLKLIKIKSFCLEIVVHNNQSSVLINNTNNWNNHTELQKLLNFLNSVTINDNVIELNNDKNIYNKTEDLKYLPKSINVNDTRNNTHENLQKPHNLFFTNKPNENLHIKFKIERDYSIQNSSNNNNEIYRTYLNITTLFHNDEQNVNKGRIDGNYNNMLLPDDVDQLRKAKTEKILHNDENLINMKSNENKFSNLNVTSSNKESDLNKIKKYTNITVELENLLSKNFNSSSFDINNLGNDRLKDTSNNVELQNHRFRREETDKRKRDRQKEREIKRRLKFEKEISERFTKNQLKRAISKSIKQRTFAAKKKRRRTVKRKPRRRKNQQNRGFLMYGLGPWKPTVIPDIVNNNNNNNDYY